MTSETRFFADGVKDRIKGHVNRSVTAIDQGAKILRDKVRESVLDRMQPVFDGVEGIRGRIESSILGRVNLIKADLRQLRKRLPAGWVPPPAGGPISNLPSGGQPVPPPAPGGPPIQLSSPPNPPTPPPPGSHFLAFASNCKGGPFPGCRVALGPGSLWPSNCGGQYRWMYQITPDGNSHDFNGNVDGSLCTFPPVRFTDPDSLCKWLADNCGGIAPPPPPPDCPPGEYRNPLTGECAPIPTPPTPCPPQREPPPPPPICDPSQIDPVTGRQRIDNPECPPTPCQPPPPEPDQPLPSALWCTLTPPDVGSIDPQWRDAASQAYQGVNTFLGEIPVVGTSLQKVFAWSASFVNDLIGVTGCDVKAGLSPWFLRAFAGFVEHWTSIGFGEVIETLSYHVHNACPVLIPDISGVIECRMANVLDDRLWKAWVRANNYCEAPIEKVVEAKRTRPNVDQVLALNLRGAIVDNDLDGKLRQLGVVKQEDADYFKEFRKAIPGPSDLVRFAVRHVFEPDLIAHFGYNDEFRPDFADWLAKQGFAYDITTPIYQANGIPLFTWAHAFWWSHWILPSPTQGYEMVQRLRPTGGPGGGPRDPSGEVFTSADLSLLLRANDYPPFWRKKLEALSYRPIGLRQLTQLARFRLSKRAELREGFMDLGFRESNADRLARLTIKQARAQKWKQQTSGTRGQLLASYRQGMVDRPTAARLLYALSLEDSVEYREYRNLPVAEQLALAVADLPLSIELDSVDLEEDRRLAGEAIGATRKMFLKGRITLDQAGQKLDGIGITHNRRQLYLRRWQQAFTPQHRELQAGQVLRMYRYNILNASVAAAYLGNLGYDLDAVSLLLLDTDRSIIGDLAKAQAQAARTAEQRRKALEAAVRAIRQEHDRLRAELARHGSPADLKTWVVLSILDPQQMLVRLLELDWPLADAQRKVLEAVEIRDGKIAAAQAREIAAAERAKRVEAAEQARLIKEERAREAKPTLLDLKRWLGEGVITVEQAVADLQAKDWLEVDIQAWLEDLRLQGILPPPTNGAAHV